MIKIMRMVFIRCRCSLVSDMGMFIRDSRRFSSWSGSYNRTMVRNAAEFDKEALTLSEEERKGLVRLPTMEAEGSWASPEIGRSRMEECDRR